jgi:predicted MPP superfamily phosphohydrolase
LFASSVGWRLRRVPRHQLTNHSSTVDIAQRLGKKPVGEGPYRYLTRVPGNEIFRVEVSQKEYRLPRLPREWDGLSILHVTDLHLIGTIDRSFFEELFEVANDMRADLVVFTGDLLDRQDCNDWLPTTMGRLDAPLGRYFILGNHDWYLDHRATRQALCDCGWIDVAGRTIEIEHRGRRLAIGGTERPWMGEHPDFDTNSQDAFRLLLSHTPDHLEFARSQNVDLMLSGHNHGGQVVLPIVGPVYAPSQFGVRYAGGVFWREPTLLYVSRGISGQHPLRINCPPELTKLVLRPG